MDNIRKYLDNLFLGLPQTPEVLRAKAELLQMMEDKYEELIKEGKSEQETFGIVVSEFGSLEELAAELGITDELKQINADIPADASTETPEPEQFWEEERTRSFLRLTWKHALFVALGVAFIILGGGMSDAISNIFASFTSKFLSETIGSCAFVLFLVCGILLCTHAKQLFKTFDYSPKKTVALDLPSAEYVKQSRVTDEDKRYKLKVAGILLCIFAFLPNTFAPDSGVADSIASFLFSLLVSGGVALLIVAGSVKRRYEELSKAKVFNQNDKPLNSTYFMEAAPKKLSSGALAAIIASAVIVACITISGAVITLVNMKDHISSEINVNDAKLVPAETFAAGDIREMNFDMDRHTVKFEASQSDKIEFSYDGDAQSKPTIQVENGIAKIKASMKRFALFHLGDASAGTIVVKVPASADKIDYTFDINAGNINMDGITGNSISFDLDAGNTTLSNCHFHRGKCDMDAGNVKLSNVTFDESFEAETDAGNITADDCSFKKLTCDLDAGDLKIVPKEAINCYDCELKASLGKIVLADTTQNGADVQLNKKSTDTSQGEHSMKLSVDMGNITITDKN